MRSRIVVDPRRWGATVRGCGLSHRQERAVFVPLTILDFLRRAEQVYGARVGVIDEPQQPAPSLGELTYARVAALARAQAAGLDALGVGFGERVAVVSQNAARLLVSFFGVAGHGRVLVPINFRLSPLEIATSSSTRGPRCCSSTPSSTRPCAG
jgi:fatty-acyl-CoA synthase